MKKRISILLLAALLLAVACPALAEESGDPWEIPVTADELLGVWRPTDAEDDVTLLIVPGSYTPTNSRSKLPEMYADCTWNEDKDFRVGYMMQLNKHKTEDNSFLSTLLGASVANAIKVIDFLSNGEKETTDFAIYDYTHATIGAEWNHDGDFRVYTDKSSGSFYAIHDEDMSVLLYWMDNYDPHVAGMEMRRVTNKAASAEAIGQGVLRPVIDMADDARIQTAMALVRWAAENHCMRMNSAAFTENVRAAFAALEPADAQAFRDKYAEISGLTLDAMGLNPATWSSPDRAKPFKDAGLGDELGKINSSMENQRAFELLNAALTEAMG